MNHPWNSPILPTLGGVPYDTAPRIIKPSRPSLALLKAHIIKRLATQAPRIFHRGHGGKTNLLYNHRMEMQKNPLRRRSAPRVLARLALFPLGLAAYLFIVFEEWLWERAKRAMAAFGKLPLVGRAERALGSAPPALAAMAFLLPGVALIPFKFAGIYMIGHGHPILGAFTFVMAKAVGAACVARVWALTEKSLRTIGWLSISVDWIVAKKDALKHWTEGLWAIRSAKAAIYRIRSGARGIRARIAAKLWGKALVRARKANHHE